MNPEFVINLAVTCTLALTVGACPSLAQERWVVQDNELIFDMGVPYRDAPDDVGLGKRDVEEFKLVIMENPAVDTIVVSGGGGYGPAGTEIADSILNFGFHTRAFGDCLSACTRIFLAGDIRRLSPEASLGFHRPYVLREEEQAYYLAHRMNRGWQDEFDYVEFIYDVGLVDMLENVEFMVSRGVAFDFIAQAYSYSSFEMWRPEVEVLLASGVVTVLE